MKYLLTAAALLAATANAQGAGCTTDGHDNWYCEEVTAISYTGVGNLSESLSYNKVNSMDSGSGACSSTPFGYKGAMSPLDEEVSLHFRGPLTLKQFAVYTPSGSSSKRSTNERRHAHLRAHAHAHHARAPEPSPVVEEKRQVGATVTATIDGVVEHWINEYSGGATSAAAAAPAAASSAAAAVAAVASAGSSSSGAASSGSSSSSSSSSDSSESVSGSWTRTAYYNSAQGTSEGLVFLNHEGGQGSGIFDYTFGNSLSYASTDGASGSSSPQTLADTTLASDTEVVIMSDQKCSGQNGDCGFYRDGTVAYHGFGGATKAFFFEFGMPSDGETTYNPYKPVNMPAIWMLNAQIPRTLQYGQADCSCWTSGCGEFDIFEVLMPGDTRCKSTLHGNVQGGDSNYFARPTSGTVKAVLLMNDNNMHIKILDSSVDFVSDLVESLVSDIVTDTMEAISGVSLFALGS